MKDNENTNLVIWDQVEKTDPTYTNKITGGLIQGKTSINGHYFFKRATEMFGPCGDGWGYDVIEERFDNGANLGFFPGTEIPVYQVNHVIILDLWYRLPGKDEPNKIRSYGLTPYIQKIGNAADFEAPKKSLTDAIKKALSMIGVGADIFLGMFDDGDYVDAVNEEARIKKADNLESEAIRLRAEFQEGFDREIQTMIESKTLYELQAIHSSLYKKLKIRENNGVINVPALLAKLDSHKDQTKAALAKKAGVETVKINNDGYNPGEKA